MKNETTEDRAALIRYEHFEKLVLDAEATLTKRQIELAKERTVYVARRPLTESERADLAVHVSLGGAICCHAGLDWLKTILPDPWARAINEWAYEHLACSPCGDEELSNRVAIVRALKLDRFP